MKKIITWLLVLLSILGIFSSCAEKRSYSFDSPYKYSNFTSDTPTYTSSCNESYDYHFHTRQSTFNEKLEWQIERHPYVVLRVSRKESESFYWEEKIMEEENDEVAEEEKIKGGMRECAYTLTTLNVLEILEGEPEYAETFNDKSEITLFEPYGIKPGGEFCYYMIDMYDSTSEEKHPSPNDFIFNYFYGQTVKDWYKTRVFDNSNDFLIILFDGVSMITENMCYSFWKSAETHPVGDIAGAYHLLYEGYCTEYTEERYNEIKDITNLENFAHIECEQFSNCMLKYFWEKYPPKETNNEEASDGNTEATSDGNEELIRREIE